LKRKDDEKEGREGLKRRMGEKDNEKEGR